MRCYYPPDTQERLARIEWMIEQYRLARQRRLMKLAMKMWRQTETDQRLVKLEAPPDRVH